LKLAACSAALLLLLSAFAIADDAQVAKDSTIAQTLLRISGIDIGDRTDLKDAVLRHLNRHIGEPEYFELIEKYELSEASDSLTKLALQSPDKTEGVRAANLLFQLGEGDSFQQALEGESSENCIAAASVLANVGDEASLAMLRPLITNESRPAPARVAAVKAFGSTKQGQQDLLALAAEKKIPAALKLVTADLLLSSSDDSVKTAAAKYFQRPVIGDGKPLPSLAVLIKQRGNTEQGKTLFDKKATCIKCHKVNGEGKEVGPDLSEIGSKLSREAMYVSILDPSAGVSHNYETYGIETLRGKIVTGIKVSETEDSVTLKTAEAIDVTIKKDDIDIITKKPTSLMPQDLQKLITAEELVDVVEYLTTLKKK